MTGVTVQEKCSEAIKKLEHKAELQRHFHMIKVRKYRFWIDLIVYSSIILSVIITFLAIADPRLFPINSILASQLIAIASILILFLSISDRIFGLNAKLSAHEQAEKLLTDTIRRCNQCRHIELDGLSDDACREKADAMRETYTQVMHIIPDNGVSDEEFLIEKQRLLLKIDLSKALDDNHNLDLTEGIGKLRALRKGGK